MHYSFNRKLNKVDSNNYKNFRIPEKDQLLNEAQLILIKTIANPRVNTYYGFERNQRILDDIQPLVISKDIYSTNNVFVLPEDYMFKVKLSATGSTEQCSNLKFNVNLQQHDDEFEDSFMEESSVLWRHLNATLANNKITTYPKDFKVDSLKLTYIKYPRFIHNAEDFSPNGYKNFKGQLLTGYVDSELPEYLHEEIVDLAVLLASSEIQDPLFELKKYKTSINQLNT